MLAVRTAQVSLLASLANKSHTFYPRAADSFSLNKCADDIRSKYSTVNKILWSAKSNEEGCLTAQLAVKLASETFRNWLLTASK